MSSITDRLAEIVGRANLFYNPAEKLVYSSFSVFGGNIPKGGEPLAVVRPTHAEQLIKLFAICAKERQAISIRGGGTSWNCAPKSDNTIIVLTTGMNRILEIDAKNRLAHVQCGVTCQQLQMAVAEYGLYYPASHGLEQISTIGGSIARNVAGQKSLKYGPIGNYVETLAVLTGGGEILKSYVQNGQAGKMSPGFPIASLFCGSLGALGIITEATLRLLPLPGTRIRLLAMFQTSQECAEAVKSLACGKWVPSVLEFLDAHSAACLNFPGALGHCALLLEFEGSEEDVMAAEKAALEILKQTEAASIVREDSGSLEKVFHDSSIIAATLGSQGKKFLLETFVCHPSRFPALVEGLENIARENEVEIVIFGHGGVARIHAAIFPGKQTETAVKASREMFTLEMVLNNELKNENEILMDRAEWQGKTATCEAYSQKLRDIFDPASILATQPMPGSCKSN